MLDLQEEYLCTRCKKCPGMWANGLCEPCNQIRIAEDAQELAAVQRAIANFWMETNMELRPGLHYSEHDGRAGWFNYDEEDTSKVIISFKASGDLFRRRYRIPISGNVYSTIDNYVLTGQLPDLPEMV
jgi:hypothetical protein